MPVFVTGLIDAGGYKVICAPPVGPVSSFETDWDGWTNSGVHRSFSRHSGSTSSIATGPQAAADGSYYAYAEVTSPNHPYVTFDLQKTYPHQLSRVSFQYHMYGDLYIVH